MGCPTCQFTNRADARFCAECGAKLKSACPACGASVGPDQKFCHACGHKLSERQSAGVAPAPAPAAYTPQHLAEKILRARSSLEGERKRVTVLFADIKGSFELIEGRDPEEARRVLDPVLAAMMDAVHRFEGTVNKVLGDGLMALFGAPIAHEDHAARACYAALALRDGVARLAADIRRDLGIEVRVRVGLHSGEVVVRAIGNDLSLDYDAIGPTAHLAARMEQLATPGAIRLTAATARLAEDLVRVEALGPLTVKGLKEPVETFELVGVGARRTRSQAAVARALAPLIGRERELAALDRALGQAAAGKGQIVGAVGEPGVGKSRLFDAFLGSPRLQGWLVLGCGCLSYGTNTPWLPVVELVKGYFGVEDRDTQESVAAKIADGLASFGEVLRPAQVALRALLDLPAEDAEWQALNPPLRRGRTLDAVRRLLLIHSEREPLVLVFEDLNWADGETLALLDSLADHLPTSRVLLLVDYRPEHRHDWGSRTYYTQLRIDPLAADRARELLAALLGDDPVLAHLKRMLIAHTEGNPLFLEEAVRDLVEAGALAGAPGAYRPTRAVGSIRLPDTVQAIIAARIDRLPQKASHVLQRAAVVGHDAPRPILEAVADLPGHELDRQLGVLQAAGFLYEARLYPELEYTFKHALIRDVAYGTLLYEARRALHRRVGEAMEALYGERVAELAEALTDHFERGEVWAKATRYALDSAEKAKARYAYPVGMRFAERALQAAGKDEGLGQEWIWASVLLGDLASLIDDLELANRSYDQALLKTSDPTERRWIANKRHQPCWATRAGAKLAYYVHGGGEDTILFVSPIGYGLAAWQPILERLCQDFRIITVDLRGTGSSDPLVRPYTEKDHALDIAAVVHAGSDGPVVGVGVSAAPNMLIRAAAADPNLFKKLVLVSADSGLDLLEHPITCPENEDQAIRQALEEGDFERAFRTFAPTIISEPGTEELVEQRVGLYLALPKETVLSFFADLGPPTAELKPLLKRIRVPTLVMHGTADRNTPFEAGQRLAEVIPGAQLYAFEGRCHLPMLTATQEFCDVLREFVRTGRVAKLATTSALVRPAGEMSGAVGRTRNQGEGR